jgi:hypothetical protein
MVFRARNGLENAFETSLEIWASIDSMIKWRHYALIDTGSFKYGTELQWAEWEIVRTGWPLQERCHAG